MAGELQPLDQQFPIVDAEGKPTIYFIQWAQQKQIDIGTSLTLQDLEDFLTAHKLGAGNGILLTPDGDLNNLPSISIANGTGLNFDAMHNLKLADTAVVPGTYGDASHVPAIAVDQQGRITGVTLVAISGGGGGASPYPMTVPNNALFSWVNQGGATVTVNANGSVSIRAPKNVGQSLRCRVMPLVAAPYTITLGMIASSRRPMNTQSAGLMLRDSVSGKIKVWAWDVEGSGSFFVPQNWNSATAFSANVFASVITNGGFGPQFFRLVDDGVNISYQVSNDGYQFITLGSAGRTTFMTADQVGFFVWEGSNTDEALITAFHWSLTQP